MAAVRVTLRRSSDGLERTFDDDLPEGDDSLYIWRDGNYACDCNRALFFARAAGEPDPVGLSCGDGGFVVKIARASDGEELYSDGPGA